VGYNLRHTAMFRLIIPKLDKVMPCYVDQLDNSHISQHIA